MKKLFPILIILISFFLVNGCNKRHPSPKRISWGRAKIMIRAGKIRSVSEHHDLTVVMYDQNNRRYITRQPKSRDASKFVKKIDPKGEKIGVAVH